MVKTEVKIECVAEQTSGKTAAIIVAAGSSSRMGNINKLLAKIDGTPVIVKTLQQFEKCNSISSIIVVTNKAMLLDIQNLIEEYKIKKVTDIILGGENRAQSAINGVSCALKDNDIVLIHDGARPLVTQKIIEDVAFSATLYGGAVPVIPVKDTIKIIDQTGKIIKTPSRDTLFCAQTPQGFKGEIYTKAVSAYKGSLAEITDDSLLAELVGADVYSVKGDYENIKITTKEDLILAEKILQKRKE